MNKQIQKIIAGIAILGSIIGGVFIVDRVQDANQIKQMRISLVEKAEQGTLTYDEYLLLIQEYDAEVKKGNFELKDVKINKDENVIKKLNEKIVK